MMPRRRWMREAGQTALTGLLCGLMVVPQAAFAAGQGTPMSGAPASKLPKRPAHEAPLTQQERVLHALNRFTFGPRPGDVEAVEKMGLDRWFMAQLHPDSIDDSAFDQRMKEYPALQLPQEVLMERFPSQQMIRMSDKRDLALPHNKVEHALYEDARYEFDQRQEVLKEQAQNGAKPGQQATANPAVDPTKPAMVRRQEMAGLNALNDQDGQQSKRPKPQSGMQASMDMAG